RVRRLLPLITTGPHPDMPEKSPKQFGAEVIVTMKDGRRLARRIDHLVCRGGNNPMSSEELFAKFEDCAGRTLAHDQIAPLFERLEALEAVAGAGQGPALAGAGRMAGEGGGALGPPRHRPPPAGKVETSLVAWRGPNSTPRRYAEWGQSIWEDHC